MHTPIPDRRWRSVMQAMVDKKPPKDTLACRVYAVITGSDKDPVLQDVIDYIEDKEYRDAAITFFLSGATLDEISLSLGHSLEVFRNIQLLVIDPAEFKHKLEILRYARHFAEVAHPTVKPLVSLGINCGPDYLINYYRYGHEPVMVDRKKIVDELTVSAYSASKLLKNNPTHEALDRFVKTANVAQKSILIYDKIETDQGAVTDALVEIEKREKAISLEQLGVNRSDLVH